MNPELGQAWFRIAVLMTLVSGILIFLEPRDSAEFVISVTSFVIGLIFMLAVFVAVRRGSR